MKLSDLIPQNAEIKLNGKIYTLNKVTLDDEVWFKEKFGVELQNIFDKQDWNHLSKIIFRLLADKSDFLPVKKNGYDEDGNSVEIKFTGPQRVLQGLCGHTDKLEAYKALLQTIGISRPLVDELIDEQLKKNEKAINQMLKETKSTGRKSSMSSQASMDTHSTSSAS